MTEATKIENQKNPNYGDAIRKLYSAQIAARDCSPAKETEVKGKIISLFKKIENLRIQAEKDKLQAINNAKRAKIAEDSAKKSAYRALLAQKNAEQKAKEAQKATNNAKALFVASEAGKVNPIQGLRLIEKVMPWANDTNSINIIKEANKTIFNQSNYHQFQEKRRYAETNEATFSPDSQWLITRDENRHYKVWSVKTGRYYDFLKDEKNIREATFSPDSQWLITRDENRNYKVWSVQTGKYYDFLKDEKNIYRATFSGDSQWLITRDENGNYQVWSVETGKYYDFLKDEKNIREATFSPDSKWLITRDWNDDYKVWSVEIGKYPDFLKDEKKIVEVAFSKNTKYLTIIQDESHKVKTYEVTTGKLIQTLWLNRIPSDIDIIDNHFLHVAVGAAIVKTDLQTQQGNIMSYGDGEELDYEYDEIVEWMKAFGDKYLLPLDEELKKKYGIKD
ncbi:hypothetical protein BWI92_09030 [Flectobacillus sp. BAB-3569]|nr:hypothetical protein BWI92_09030 [Flectobacillus sp. BAB-3569]